MAEVQWEGKVVGLNFIVCGPTQVGKSTVLAALRAPLRTIDDGENKVRCTPLEVVGPEETLGIVPSFLEVHSEVTVEEQATPLLASTDGVLFVADSRRERLRDDVVSWAWLLEHLRAAKRDDVPIVVCNHRRDAPNAMPASDLDGALGIGRHPFFETDKDNPGGMLAAVIELVRRAAARAHPAVEALWPGWQKGVFLGGLDARLGECNSRVGTAAAAPAAPAPVEPVATPVAAAPAPAPAGPLRLPVRPEDSFAPSDGARPVRRARRAPLLRYASRCCGDAGRVGRERRLLIEQLTCVVEDSRRPMAFLKTLFDHLGRERKRLPGPLSEGVAGGAEILRHLDSVLATAQRGVEFARGERARERRCDLAEMLHTAWSSLRHDETTARVRLRFSRLPVVRGDAQALGTLLWAALAAVLRASRQRERRVVTVHVSARMRARALRLRFARFDSARRGAGIDELLLARRLAQKFGIGFSIVAGRRGDRAVALDLPIDMLLSEPTGAPVPARASSPLS